MAPRFTAVLAVAALTLMAGAGCSSAAEEPVGTSAAKYTEASDVDGAYAQAQNLLRDISDEQARAVEQVLADSEVSDPPDALVGIVEALAGALLDAAFGALAERAIAVVVAKLAAAEESLVDKAVTAVFTGIKDNAVAAANGAIAEQMSRYHYPVSKAFLLGVAATIRQSASEKRLDLRFDGYTLARARAVVAKLHGARDAAYDAQYKATLRDYCLMMARSRNGMTAAGATDLQVSRDEGVMRVQMEIDATRLSYGDYSARPLIRGLRIAGLNESMRAAMNVPAGTLYGLGLPLYIDGVYEAPASAPLDQPPVAGFRIGRNESGEIFVLGLDGKVPWITTAGRDFLVYLAHRAGHADTRDTGDADLASHAKEGAKAVFDAIGNASSPALPTPGG